ncbi:MAG: prolyl oligopeptidase family serine peptidase [Armatimonadia bacterium]
MLPYLLSAFVVIFSLGLIVDASAQNLPPIKGMTLSEVTLPSSLDGKQQPVIVGVPENLDATKPTPLLVGIHTWSADDRQQTAAMAPLCARYGWLMILPNFRGANVTTNPAPREAGASLPAQHDILDAVNHMKSTYRVDESRIYIIGGSGGGHMSLMMAGKYPDIWAGVSAWCPVSSLSDWHAQQNGYAPHIEAVAGGKPGDSAEVDFEYLRRSPRTFLTNAANTNLQICHGDKDQTIWVTQTWKTYEVLRPLKHRAEFYSWTGGHDMLTERGFEWLSRQVKPSTAPLAQHLVTDEAKWYFWLYVAPGAPNTFARCDAILTPATPAKDNEPAQPAKLAVAVEQAKDVRLNLGALSLSNIKSATCGGQPSTSYTVADGILSLPGAVDKVTYEFTF